MEKTFLEHLEEVRGRALLSVLSIILASALFFVFLSEKIILLLQAFYNVNLFTLSLFEVLLVRIEVSLTFGILFSLPYILFHAVTFIKPALNKNEQRILLIALVLSAALALIGIVLNVVVLFRALVALLVSLSLRAGLSAALSASNFFSLLILTSIATAIILQTPLFVKALISLRILDKQRLKELRPIIYFLTFLVTGLITPDPTFVSQVLLGVLVMVLFELTLAVS